MQQDTPFDVEEYLHLALHASTAGNHHACMTYLKEALQKQPDYAAAIFLLAVQHAELGLLDRAIRGMKTALELEPELQIARLQLGIMLLDKSRRTEAREQFAALDRNPDPMLRTFAAAMLAFSDGDTVAARDKLNLALSQPSSNPALSALIRRLLDKLIQSESTADARGTQRTDVQDNQLALRAYTHASS